MKKSGMWEIRAKNLEKWDITFVSPLPVPTRGQATSTLPVDYDRGPGRKTIISLNQGCQLWTMESHVCVVMAGGRRRENARMP